MPVFLNDYYIIPFKKGHKEDHLPVFFQQAKLWTVVWEHNIQSKTVSKQYI